MNQQQDKNMEAHQSHAQLLRDTLERAMNSPNGMWVNSQAATAPSFYLRQGKIAAFSTLLMALHSQIRGCSLNTYVSYSDAKTKNIRFGDYNSGIQVPYVRQDGYRNRLSNQLITEAQYKALSKDEAASYRPNFQRFLRMAYNIDQTNLRQINPEAYAALQHGDGPEKIRGINSLEKECDDLTDFDDNCALYERHIVGIMPIEEQRTHYEAQNDIVAITSLGAYPSTDTYIQDGYRAFTAATAHPSRLNRNTSSEQAQVYEKLVQECVSAMRMVLIGRTAGISPENKNLIPRWMEMLRQNPRLVLSLERDVNLAQEMLHKAEMNEKLMYKPKPKEHEAGMPVEDMLALKDILAYGGMVTNPKNYSSEEAYRAMLEKYGLGELHTQIERCHRILNDNESLKARGKVTDDTYLQTKSDIYKELSKLGSEMSDRIVSIIPRPWDYYGRRYIAGQIERLLLDDRKEMVLVQDPEKKIVDVLVPTDARRGGTVTLANGQKVPFWLDPLEQLTPRELEGATITKADPDWLDKAKVEQAIKEDKGAEYVRFFESDGPLGFYPPNDYFIGKEMTSSKITQEGKIASVLTYDLSRILHDTCAMDFESISVIKDENGSWVMNMQTKTGENLSLYPTQDDLKIFFEQCRDNLEHSLATKRELAQKYYNLALEQPGLNVDIFNKVPDGIDPECIARVYIYKDPKFGVQMMKPTIRGLDNVKPRPINKSQYQKLWIAPDIDRYRKALACRVFADIIPIQYGGGALIDPNKVPEPRASFVGVITGSYADKIIDRILSAINTSENNRNLHPQGNPVESESRSRDNKESKEGSPAEEESKTSTQTTSETEGKTRPKIEDLDPSMTDIFSSLEDSTSNQREDESISSPKEDSAVLAQAEEDRNNERSTSTTPNTVRTQSSSMASYSESNSESSRGNKVKEPGGVYIASASPEFATASEESQRAQGLSETQTRTTYQGRSISTEYSTKSTSQTSKQESEQMREKVGNNPEANQEEEVKPTEPSPSVNNGQPTADNAQQKSQQQPSQEKDLFDVTVSVELLNQYKKLRRMYPDAFIMVSEDGYAKSLHDNAFQAYDIIHDGHPVVFVQNPLSENKKDLIPVFEIPESQVEDELNKLMRRNTSVIVSRLEDELNLDKEKGFRLNF